MFLPLCARGARDTLGLLQAVLWLLAFLSDPRAHSLAIPASAWCCFLISQAVCWAGAHSSRESSQLGLFLLGQTLSWVS